MTHKPEEVRVLDLAALAQAMYEANIDILEKHASKNPDLIFSSITLATLMLLYSASSVFSIDRAEIVKEFCANLSRAADMKITEVRWSMPSTMH